jgi:hypothetical protein
MVNEKNQAERPALGRISNQQSLRSQSRRAPATTAAPTAGEGRDDRGAFIRHHVEVLVWLRLQTPPVSHDIRPIAVNLEPGDRFRQHGAVKQCALGPCRGLRIEQAWLQRQDLLQTLDVSPGNRQHSQFDPPLERIG